MVDRADAVAGQCVGLLGGSFNPAHEGHVEITDAARRALGFAQAWWLVSPGNPLKNPASYQPLEERVAHARALTAGRPWLTVSTIESRLGTQYTVDTLRYLTRRFARTRFIWIMGADNLGSFHRWKGWREIASMVPICVISRPGYGNALSSVAARTFAEARLRPEDAPGLCRGEAPAWVYLPTVHNPVSATAIRARRSDRA